MYAFIDRGQNKPIIVRADEYERDYAMGWWRFWVNVDGKAVITAWVHQQTVEEVLPLDCYEVGALKGVEFIPVQRDSQGRFIERH